MLGNHLVHADTGKARAELQKVGSLGLRRPQHHLETHRNANWGPPSRPTKLETGGGAQQSVSEHTLQGLPIHSGFKTTAGFLSNSNVDTAGTSFFVVGALGALWNI